MIQTNTRLIALVIVLLAVNVLVYFLKDFGSANFNEARFSVVPSSLEEIVFKGEDQEVKLVRADGNWRVDNAYDTDAGLVNVLLAVLERVRVSRELGASGISDLVSRIDRQGVWVQLAGERESDFYVIGNETKTKTYFMDKDQKRAFEVEIPGYTDYVGGIFELSPEQWRDRTIFDGNARTIQSVRIVKNNSETLSVNYSERFYTVEGVDDVDTLKLVDYLNNFRSFQANEMIAMGKFPRYDSLRDTDDFTIIEIDDIARNESFELKIFPALPGEGIQLAISEGEMMVFDRRRIAYIDRNPEEFSN